MNGNEKLCYLSENLLKVDDRYYQAYLEFFTAEVKVKTFNTILEQYIFALKANFVEGDGKQPEMLTRFFAGLVHPLIHTGLGVEFDLPGTFAEGTDINYSYVKKYLFFLSIGLAQTAVHPAEPQSALIIPSSSWSLQGDNDELVSRLARGLHLDDTKTRTHAFTILARILADPRFDLGKPEGERSLYTAALHKTGDAVRELVDQWDLTGDFHKNLEELLWTNVLIYGVGGSEKSGDFNADFFL
jgi:hypothetical protein